MQNSNLNSSNQFDDAYVAGVGSIKDAIAAIEDRLRTLEEAKSQPHTEDDDFVVVGTPSRSIDAELIDFINKQSDDNHTKTNKAINIVVNYIDDRLSEVRKDIEYLNEGFINSADNSEVRENFDSILKRVDVIEAKADNAHAIAEGQRSKTDQLSEITHRLLSKMQTEIETNYASNRTVVDQVIKFGEVMRDMIAQVKNHGVILDTLSTQGDAVDHLTERYCDILEQLKANPQGESTSIKVDRIINLIDELRDRYEGSDHAIIANQVNIKTLTRDNMQFREKVARMEAEQHQLRAHVDALVDEQVLLRHNALCNTVTHMATQVETMAAQIEQLTAQVEQLTTKAETDDDSTITTTHEVVYTVVSASEPHIFRVELSDHRFVVPTGHEFVEKTVYYHTHKLTFTLPDGSDKYRLVGRILDETEWKVMEKNMTSATITYGDDQPGYILGNY